MKHLGISETEEVTLINAETGNIITSLEFQKLSEESLLKFVKSIPQPDMNQISSCPPKVDTPDKEIVFELFEKLHSNITELLTLSGDNLKLLADTDVNKLAENCQGKYSLDWMEEIVFCANERLLEMQKREDAKNLLLALNCKF